MGNHLIWCLFLHLCFGRALSKDIPSFHPTEALDEYQTDEINGENNDLNTDSVKPVAALKDSDPTGGTSNGPEDKGPEEEPTSGSTEGTKLITSQSQNVSESIRDMDSQTGPYTDGSDIFIWPRSKINGTFNKDQENLTPFSLKPTTSLDNVFNSTTQSNKVARDKGLDADSSPGHTVKPTPGKVSTPLPGSAETKKTDLDIETNDGEPTTPPRGDKTFHEIDPRIVKDDAEPKTPPPKNDSYKGGSGQLLIPLIIIILVLIFVIALIFVLRKKRRSGSQNFSTRAQKGGGKDVWAGQVPEMAEGKVAGDGDHPENGATVPLLELKDEQEMSTFVSAEKREDTGGECVEVTVVGNKEESELGKEEEQESRETVPNGQPESKSDGETSAQEQLHPPEQSMMGNSGKAI
ncbi:hypothetical protein GDO86_018824 [Hymenochirus boettgeri]|uniref:Uncharacterized protein n=1 Tax=Hymenochirus boettgeri TaxID=247094 RepID=A0A8T2IJT9_9PIPI|nr:hypothetical protein GDO86_018824 [Hymenochirus boettgeri]